VPSDATEDEESNDFWMLYRSQWDARVRHPWPVGTNEMHFAAADRVADEVVLGIIERGEAVRDGGRRNAVVVPGNGDVGGGRETREDGIGETGGGVDNQEQADGRAGDGSNDSPPILYPPEVRITGLEASSGYIERLQVVGVSDSDDESGDSRSEASKEQGRSSDDQERVVHDEESSDEEYHDAVEEMAEEQDSQGSRPSPYDLAIFPIEETGAGSNLNSGKLTDIVTIEVGQVSERAIQEHQETLRQLLRAAADGGTDLAPVHWRLMEDAAMSARNRRSAGRAARTRNAGDGSSSDTPCSCNCGRHQTPSVGQSITLL
jgi:hypothetical protein